MTIADYNPPGSDQSIPSTNDTPITYTIFPSVKAQSKREKTLPWGEITRRLAKPPKYNTKTDAPLISFCSYDGSKSPRGSMRHAAAITEVFAIEGDYDGEKMSIEEAAALLRTAGVAAIFYASPSSHAFNADTGDFRGPRWRVVTPLSKPVPRHDRRELVAKLNGLLNGVLTGESFTLGQTFYFGNIRESLFCAEIVEGAALDVWLSQHPQHGSVFPLTMQSPGGGRDKVQDPRNKLNAIGQFCTAYCVEEAIAEFLPHVFEHVKGNRYTWVGHAAGGVYVSDDGLHIGASHDSWVFGTNKIGNAFDLVRQFKFDPELKELSDPRYKDLPPFKRPSFKAMLDWMRTLPALQALGFGLTMHSTPQDVDAHLEAIIKAEEQGAQEGEQGGSDDAPTSPSPKDFRLADFDELLNAKPISWQVKHLLPRASLAMIYGASGAGKSFAAIDLALAIARGNPYGHPASAVKSNPGAVIYVAAEGAGGIGQRLLAYAKHHNISSADLAAPFKVLAAAPDLSNAEDVARIVHAANTQLNAPPALIVMDTFAQVTPGLDENSKDVQQAISMANELIARLSCTVLLIHHAGKDEARGARGWSGIRAAVDTELHVLKDKQDDPDVAPQWLMEVTKQKDGRDDLKFWFSLRPIHIGTDEDGEDITSMVVEHLPPTNPDGTPRQLSSASHPRRKDQVALNPVQQAIYDVIAAAHGWVSYPDVIDRARELISQETGTAPRKGNLERSLDRMFRLAKEVGLEVKSGGRAGKDGQQFRVFAGGGFGEGEEIFAT